MRSIMPGICVLALAFAGSMAASQDKGTASNQSKEVQQDTRTITHNGTNKTSTDTVYGRVEKYDPGKSINITVPGKIASTKTFDLNAKDETVNVASNVKTGEWVSVKEKTENNGHKTVMVERSSRSHASRAKRKTQ